MSDSSISAYQIRIGDSPSLTGGDSRERPDVDTEVDVLKGLALATGNEFAMFRELPLPNRCGVGPELVGQKLFGNYAILDVVGEGGMAIVYKAKQISFDRLVAMKTLKRYEPRMMARFAGEARTHCKLKHPNIVDVFDKLELPDGRVFLVMEYIEGVTLQDFIYDGNYVKREEDIERVVAQVCDALTYAHSIGVVHRDLKPANVVLFERNSDVHAKVLDFGLAIMPDVLQRLTLQGHTVGSLDYMSPEHCTGINFSYKSDIYSLGVMIYQMVTGRRPYTFNTVAALMNAHRGRYLEVPPLSKYRDDLANIDLLDEIVSKALSTEPEDRQTSAEELKEEIVHWRKMCRSTSYAHREKLKNYITGIRKTIDTTKWMLPGRGRQSPDDRRKLLEIFKLSAAIMLIIALLILLLS